MYHVLEAQKVDGTITKYSDIVNGNGDKQMYATKTKNDGTTRLFFSRFFVLLV